MRLSCQLRKYLSQFAACNGLALSSTRASRDRRPDRRPITTNLLAFRRPACLSPSLFILSRSQQSDEHFRPTGLAPSKRTAEPRETRAATFACTVHMGTNPLLRSGGEGTPLENGSRLHRLQRKDDYSLIIQVGACEDFVLGD